MKYARKVCLFLVLAWVVLGCLSACGPRQTVLVFPQGEKIAEGVWNLQYKLQLDLPRWNFSQGFTGMMRLDLATHTAQVAGVAGLGLQLFAMRVTPVEAVVEYMHPMLHKIPHAPRYITSCIRTIWLAYLPQIHLNTFIQQGDVLLAASGERVAGLWPERIRYEDGQVPFTLSVRLLQAQQEKPQ